MTEEPQPDGSIEVLFTDNVQFEIPFHDMTAWKLKSDSLLVYLPNGHGGDRGRMVIPLLGVRSIQVNYNSPEYREKMRKFRG